MNETEARQCVGAGWSLLIEKFFAYKHVLEKTTDAPIKIVTLNNARGMLKIECKYYDETIQDMIDKLCWALERNSATVCEICGAKGFRRKTLPNTPNRCKTHYIELLNELTDDELDAE